MGRMFAGLEARVITGETVKEAYRHLLGRVPSESETALMVAHFSAGGIDQTAELHDSIFRSEEFRCRRVNTYRWEQFHPLELDSPRLVFVHIEKCAGTTLRMMLETQFSPSRICPERFDGLGNWTINELASYDLFAGHFNLSVTRSIPGRVRVITMLREPKARLISLFHFWKSHLPDAGRDRHNLMALARDLDAEAFFSKPFVRSHPSIRDAMTSQLICSGGKQVVDENNILIKNPSAALMRGLGQPTQHERLRNIGAFRGFAAPAQQDPRPVDERDQTGSGSRRPSKNGCPDEGDTRRGNDSGLERCSGRAGKGGYDPLSPRLQPFCTAPVRTLQAVGPFLALR